jgi:protease PrsW
MTTSRLRAQQAAVLLLTMPAMAWTVDLLIGTPPIVLAAAVVPAALAAAAILFVQRGSGRSPLLLGLAFLWGAAGAAFLSSTGNALARQWFYADTPNAHALTALLFAPIVEESAKAAGLLLIFLIPAFARRGLRDARDGILYGALIAVGFTFTENLLYLGVAMLQGGSAGLARALYLRGIIGAATHVVFTACVGAGLGRWADVANRSPSRWLVPAAAFLFAVVQHAAWNGVGAPWIESALCGAAEAGALCRDRPTAFALFGAASIVATLFLAPGVGVLWAAWVRPSQRR